jgi:hypothetical protein
MKRATLLCILSLLVSVSASAQQKISRHGLLFERTKVPAAITGEEGPGEIVRTVKPHSGVNTNAVGPGFSLMESTYDYGSNGGVLPNIWDYGDGTIAVARMGATQPNPFADRGTYFTYFDGAAWWLPMTRVEAQRRGWSNISSVADGRSVTGSHVANEVNVDALKGFGIWTSTVTNYANPSLVAIWPRLAVDGRDNIFVCSSLQGSQFGIAGRKEVAISRDGGIFWTHQILLPDTSERKPQFTADDQAMDSFGDNVAIAASEIGGDIHLWESFDNGATWQYRNVTNYPRDIPVGAEAYRPFRACDVLFDNEGNLHIFWETLLAAQDTAGTELELFYNRNAGIQHWSQTLGQTQAVSWADLPGAEAESDDDLFRAGGVFDQINADMSLVGQPQAGVDSTGSLFLLFAALRPRDYDADSTHFTDLYAVRSDHGGAAWGVPVNVSDTPQSEDLWASLADNVYDDLRFVYQSDGNTGNSIQGGGAGPTQFLYYAFPANELPPGQQEGRHLTASPHQLTFGKVYLGDTTTVRAVTLRNTGTETVTVSQISASRAEFKLRNLPALPLMLMPDSTRALQVAFVPSASGALDATLNIESDDVDTPNLMVALQGIGVQPPPPGTALFALEESSNIVQIDPVFGNVLRRIPAPVSFFGNVSGLAFDGVSLFFSAGFSSNLIYVLNPNTGAVRYSFAAPPGVAVDGLAHSGVSLFILNYNNRIIYEVDPVTGQVLNNFASNAFLRGALTFGGGRQTLFAERADLNEVVELNPFTGAIVNRIPMPPGEAIFGLGYSDRLQILFAGTYFWNGFNYAGKLYALNPNNGNVLETYTGYGLLYSVAADEYHILPGPQLLTRPGALDFGKVALGKASLSQKIRLQNIGAEEVIISNIAHNEASFQILDRPGLPFRLAPRTLAELNVAFAPERLGAVSDTLRLTSNDPDGPVQSVVLAGIGAKPPRPGTIFASTGRFDSLLTINPATGRGMVVGATTGFGRMTELEFRADGVLFGATDQGRLVSVDVITGKPSQIGSHSGFITALEFDATGRLFGAYSSFSGSTSQLVTINTSTGALTFIGTIGFVDVGGLSFAPDGSLLGVTGGFSATGGDLIRINTLTGRGTLIGRTGFRDVAALEFDRLGKLYAGLGANDPNGGRLAVIDPTTAAGTIIGPSGFSEITGLAIVPGFDLMIAIADTLQAEPGAVFDVPVMLNFTADSIGAVGAALKATTGILAFEGFAPGAIIPGSLFNAFAPASDSVRFAYVDLGGGAITQQGVLVTLRFTVAASAPLGATALLRLSDFSATDAQSNVLVTGGVNGLLTVVKFVAVSGNAQYCRLENSAPAKPVADLSVQLSQRGAVLRRMNTSAEGNFAFARIAAGPDFDLAARRASGGINSSISVTDAFLAFNAFIGQVTLKGCQSLAADVDANRLVQPRDVQLIFDFYLGKRNAFPAEAWRTFPASYEIDADADAWKAAPQSIAYPNLFENRSEQNFLAVVLGDVDLSWQDSASTSLIKNSAVVEGVQLRSNCAPLASGEKKVSWQILLEGPKVVEGLYAFGAELRYDAGLLEITAVRWGNVIPTEGFTLDYHIQRPIASQETGASTLNGGIRFGGFANAAAMIRSTGVLIEVEAQLQSELAMNEQLPLRLANAVATMRNAGTRASINAGFTEVRVATINGEAATAALPADFLLHANYPNPFNPGTRIEYQLPEAALVRLEIFNALGQKVRELIRGEQRAPGSYALEWDGRNEAHLAAAGGVYLLKLEAVSAARRFTQTRKMLLIK